MCRDLGIIPANYPDPLPMLSDPISSVKGVSVNSALDLQQETDLSVLVMLPDHPYPDQCVAIRQRSMTEFSNVFTSSNCLREMEGEPMKIHLCPEATPFAIHGARSIPFAWWDEV